MLLERQTRLWRRHLEDQCLLSCWELWGGGVADGLGQRRFGMLMLELRVFQARLQSP
jgi:hypothetical protein